MDRSVNPGRGVSLLSLLILLVTTATVLSPVEGSHLSANLRVSAFIENAVVYNIIGDVGGSGHQLDGAASELLSPMGCPSDLFSVQGGVLVALGPLPQAVLEGPPLCVSHVNLVAVASYSCVVRFADSNVQKLVSVVVNILPEPASLSFPSVAYNGTVLEEEERAVVTRLGSFQASSISDFPYSPLQYSISSGSDNFYIVNEIHDCVTIPVLVANQSLDAEQTANYELVVEAIHPLNATMQSSAVVRVSVVDINDHSPLFSINQQSTFTINSSAEVGKVVGSLIVTDEDSGLNGVVTFHLKIPNQFFSVDPISGNIFVIAQLASAPAEQLVTVVATDNGNPPRTAEQTVTIIIHPVAQSAPTINATSTNVTVPEHSATGTTVTTLQVLPSSLTEPSLSLLGSASQLFGVSLTSSVNSTVYMYSLMVSGDLDRESFPNGVMLLLVASDGGNPSFSSTIVVTIHLEDINDNPPQFMQAAYFSSVFEGSPSGVAIITPLTSDRDVGMNADVQFSLIDPPDLFEVDPSTGSIITAVQVPKGTLGSWTLTLRATGQVHSATTTVSISVEAYNTQPPTFITPAPPEGAAPGRSFQSHAVVTVPETSQASDIIYTFLATDPDSGCGGRVTYSITLADPPVVQINELTGALYPKADGALDSDQFSIVRVTVRATDNGLPTPLFSEANLQINIQPANDNPPLIDTVSCPCFLEENSPSVQFCRPLSATDEDGDTVRFSILAGNELDHFSIDENIGRVQTATGVSLDRETVPQYSLTIAASDGVHWSNNVTLLVIVRDIDDSNIRYETSTLAVRVPIDAELGATVASLSVNVNDAGFNGLVTYSASMGLPASLFQLDPATADLVVIGNLNVGTTRYSFTVNAQERGQPSNTAVLSVTLSVVPSLKAPSFRIAEDRVTVPQNLQVGAVIALFSATASSGASIQYTAEDLPSIFSLSASTGALTLQQPLGVSPSVYRVNVTATVAEQAHLTSSQVLEITVYSQFQTDIAGSPIRQPAGMFVCRHSGEIPEFSTSSSTLVTLPSLHLGQMASYSLEPSEHSSAFVLVDRRLQARAGVSNIFDLTQREAIFLTLRVTFGAAMFHRCAVTVYITDINNHPPTFLRALYSADLYRNSPVNTIVFRAKATDIDSSSTSPRYALQNTNTAFSLNTDTGILQLSQSLTSSQIRTYNLTLLAIDRDNSSLTSQATLIVSVLELSNTAPPPPPVQRVNIAEDMPTESQVASVATSDADEGIHGRLNYCLLGGNVRDRFRVTNSGTVLISRPLDFEQQRSYALDFYIYDSSPNPQFSLTTVNIDVTDINEAPIFLPSAYKVAVREDSPPLSHIVTVRASDDDTETSRARTVFSITAGNDDNDLTIDPATGDIFITSGRSLNREQTDSYQLTVVASNPAAIPVLSSTVQVEVEVVDVNDNTPTFNSVSDVVRVDENTALGTVIYSVSANDNDTGANADVFYRIASGNDDGLFALDGRNGELTLVRALDHETSPNTISLNVEAFDVEVTASATLQLVVQVMGINDHPPSFTQFFYSATVQENELANTIVGHVSAVDYDKEGNTVSYSLKGDGEADFTISSMGEIRTARIIDREQSAYYFLTVTAMDGGTPRRSAAAIVHVVVGDVNDNPPQLESNYSLFLPEDQPLNVPFFILQATDEDDGQNAEVVYSVEPAAASHWGVGPTSGALYLKRKLDFESATSHSFVVTAQNTESPQASAQTVINIQVLDIPENTISPHFPPLLPNVLPIPANARVGTLLANVSAVDPDPGRDGEVVYTTTGGTGIKYFSLNNRTGEVVLVQPLSSAAVSFLTLEIQIRDNSVFPLFNTRLFVVNITTPTLPPRFTSPTYHFSVQEGSPAGTSVGLVAVAEVYHAHIETVSYSIMAGNQGGTFNINSTNGILSVAGSVNRESIAEHHLQVTATNSDFPSQPAHTLVLVSVLDQNDNRPDFRPSSSYMVSIFNNFQVSPLIPFMRVFAFDPDDPAANGRVTYTLQSSSSSTFAVSSTGNVYLTATPSGSNHMLTVRAVDSGSTPLDSTATITVNVISPAGSMQQPSFSPPSLSVSVQEDASIGTVVHTAVATDGDSPVIMYGLAGNSSSQQHFAIHPNTGVVYVAGQLNREMIPRYILNIQAWDGFSFSVLSLTVTVTDVNDNIPQFSSSSYTFSVSEKALVNTKVGSVAVSDEDVDLNGQVVLDIVDSTAAAGVFGLAGMDVVVVGPIDREVLPTHYLTVRGRDRGDSSLESYCRVIVEVEDVNNNNPTFSSPLFHLSVNENTSVNHPIATITAFDYDRGRHSVVVYTISPPNVHFSIDGSTGRLSLVSQLDFNTEPSHTLSIIASDKGTPSNSGSTTIFISVLPDFNSPPNINNPGLVSIVENLPPNTMVSSVAGVNDASVAYTLDGGEGFFWIDSKTGVIRTSTTLDREELARHLLTATVHYVGEVGATNSVSFTVQVSDVNDNAPMLSPQDLVEVTIGEDAQPTLTAFSLSVEDIDSSVNANIDSFVLLHPLAAEHFLVESDGQVKLLLPLDVEGSFDYLDIPVAISDTATPTQLAVQYIHLSVEDRNDESPVFSRDVYSAILLTPTPRGSSVIHVSATDADSGIGGVLEFSISGGNGTSRFAINSQSGEVFLDNPYRLQPYYHLEVTATDKGNRPHSSTVDVFIMVRDCPLLTFRFTPPEYSLTFPENAAVNTIIASPVLIHTGIDASALRFSLLTGEGDIFDVNELNGIVSLRANLDRERQDEHQLAIQARHLTDVTLVADLSVTVMVHDVNDNAPQFTSITYQSSIVNDADMGDPVVRVSADDPDLGDSGQVSYHIVSGGLGLFTVNGFTGEVSVFGNLASLQSGTNVSLTVEARDHGTPVSLSNTTTVTILIVDSRSPTFTQSLYHANVSEAAGMGTPVITVTATVHSGFPTYIIESGDDFNQFDIDFYNGKVTVERALNYELIDHYTLLLKVSDPTLPDTSFNLATLEIDIVDVNDNSPIFSPNIYSSILPENSTQGTLVSMVTATDLDAEETDNSRIIYALPTDFPFIGIFTIDSTSGQITLTGEIDYETNPVYEFRVHAIDAGRSPRTGTATVRLSVVNINDNAPAFVMPLFELSVQETAHGGSVVGSVNALDPDLDTVTYSITDGNDDRLFLIDLQTGEIRLSPTASGFNETTYNLTVSAFDGILYGEAIVRVSIADINDNSPVFIQPVYEGRVMENSGSDVDVVQVSATDKDRISGVVLQYSLGMSVRHFKIDPVTGQISTSRDIDREQDPEFEFHVFVTDSLFTGSALVRVRVLDKNDNTPVFRTFAAYEAQVKENADVQSTVASVTADDPDEGSNGAVTYSLGIVTDPVGLDPNLFPFFVVSASGAIKLRSSLNFELTDSYTFTIVAADQGNTVRSTQRQFTIEVLDVDDTPPVFEQPGYNFTILEEPSDRTIPVGRVAATSDSTAPIDYVIAGSGSSQLPFGVNQNDGNITVEGFIDREFQSQYLFTVEAYTFVNSRLLKSSVSVTITVLDKNDNRPRFAVPRYQGQVAENRGSNTPVETSGSSVIQATDRDNGENGTVSYRIVEDSTPFIIDNSGQIFTTRQFDREDEDHFTFTVLALDQGTPPLTSTSFVRATIMILDTNDQPPVFKQRQYSATVLESAEDGETVIPVEATDADLGENADITYSLQGSTLFAIGPKTGIVTLSGSLDRELVAEHNLTIGANDGVFSDSAHLIVTVADVNDEPPVFNSSDYTTTVEENASTDAPLLSVEAADPDQKGTVIYSISVGPSRNNFTIHPISGELRFSVPPDYEEAQQLEIQVVARDGVHEVLATVTVYITDMNDERPSFNESSFIGSVQENQADSIVEKISANDRDSGEGGIVTYQIVGGKIGNESVTDASQLPFRLTTPQSGLIVTTQELDREAVSEYTLIVRASDRGEPSLSSTTTVTVTVLDDNDHSPVFLQPMYEADLSESSALETFVEMVRATDEDSGNNAKVFYVFDAANNSQHFSIDAESGKITVADILDFETQPTYHLTVIAYDSGQFARSGTAVIVINISDENDNRPIFQQQNYLKIVSESIDIGSSLLRVVARDQDSGTGAAAIVYSIIDGSSLPEFRVGPNTGMLYVNSKLDFERRRQYQFRVRAENAGDNPLFDIAHVNITLTDVNDEVPMFVPANPVYSVTEGVGPPFVVGTLSAIDPDSVTNPDDITFTIISGNEDAFFDLDERSGSLVTRVVFDREEKAKYRLTVTADDGGTPSQTGTAQIIVVIGDVNDNDPQEGHADIFVYILADEFIPGLIGQVNANDPDEVNSHVYMILNLPTPFVLHDNGTIESTSKPSLGVYSFKVNVSDNSPEVMCTVRVTVEDIERQVAERSVTMRVRGDSVQEFLEGKIMPFTSGGMPIFQAVVPGSGTPFVVSVQVVDDVDEITDVSFAVPLSDGTGYVDQELVRHIVHISRSQLASSEIGVSVETELPDLCVSEPCGANGICCNVLSDINSTLLSLSPAHAIVAPSPVWDYQCVCLPGISGRHCDSGSLDFCSINPCPSPMICTNGATAAICNCPEGSESQNGVCTVNQTACLQEDCQNGASCVVTREGLSCACLEGYVGNRCQIEEYPPNLCLFANCNAGATCTYSHVGFTCSCPPGLTGVQCNTTSTSEVAGCSLNPCQAGGTCNTRGSNYSCTCPEGYTGANCEVFIFADSASSSVCDSAGCAEDEDCIEINGQVSCLSPCSPNPCLHGGACVRQLPGFTCDCPVQYRGPRCEVTLANFSLNSFAVFPSIHTPLNSSIYLEFATDVQYGLLFLNGRYDKEGADFISLELLQGSLKYSLSRGGAEQSVLEYSQGGLSDMKWHSVVVGFNATHMWMFVDDCTNDNVDLGPVGRVGGPLDTPTCNEAVKLITGTYLSLDATAPLILGSHPSSFDYGPEESYFPYNGFIRNMRVADTVLDFSTPLTSKGVSSSLSLENDPCASTPCHNMAQCLPMGFTYVCLCGSAFTGQNCEDVAPSAAFSGTNLIRFNLAGSVGRVTRQSNSHSTRATTLTIGFSSSSSSGTLFAMTGDVDYAFLELERGYLQFRYNLGSGEVIARVTGRQFGEGDYHEVEVRRDGRTAVVWVDGLYVARATAPGPDAYLDLHPNGIFLGGRIDTTSGALEDGFSGCLRGATLDGKLLPLSESNEDFEVTYSGLDMPTFGCWVPPTGPITTPAPTLPLLYIILITVVVVLVLLAVACVVTVAIVYRCRKTRKRDRRSLYEMRDDDFELRSEAGPPRLTVQYWTDEPGVSQSSAGNIRSYDHEGGGESDVGMLHMDINSTVSQTVSSNHALEPQFSTFSTIERHSNVRVEQPVEPPPVQLTQTPEALVQSQHEERYVTRREGEATGAISVAEATAVLYTEEPTPLVKPTPAARREAAATNTTTAESTAELLTERPVPPVKPKPVDIPVPQPKSRREAEVTNTSAAASAAVAPTRRPVPPVKPKPVNFPVPQSKTRREAEVASTNVAAESSAALPTEPPAKPKPVDVPVPQPKSHSKPQSHFDAKGKQIWKRKQAADAVVLQDDFDETMTFTDEGNLTPLGYGSLRSLYRMQDTEDDSSVPTIIGPSAPRFSHLLALLRELNVTDDDDDDVSSTSTADSITSGTIQAGVADQSNRNITPPPIPVKKHKNKLPTTTVTVRQV